MYNGSSTANAAVDELLALDAALDAALGVYYQDQAVMAALVDKKAFAGQVICPVAVFRGAASLAPLAAKTRDVDGCGRGRSCCRRRR